MARQAFKFCLKHNRKVEFRRLCDTLRIHLQNIAKYSQQQHAINLSDPDTLQRHLETRFAQLSAAAELELWQEAFRTVEDIHNLLTLAKKAPRPSMMAGYYEKLTKIFLMSGSDLYHAAAWNKYFSIVRVSPGANVAKLPEDEDMSKLAGLVLLSALAIPIHCETNEQSHHKVSRLIALLGMSKMPTRSSLLASALGSCTVNDVPLLKSVPTPIKALYKLVEVSFEPLRICEKAAPLLQQLETEYDGLYKPYISSLRDVILNRLLLQASQVYESIETSRLFGLAKPLHIDGDLEATFETIIVHAARRGDLSVKIDHSSGLVSFHEEAFTSPSRSKEISAAGPSQFSTYRSARNHLSSVANVLAEVIQMIEPTSLTALDFKELTKAAEVERKALNLRRNIIARRRELQSELHARKEKEEAGRRAEVNRREKDEEAKRALEDVRRKEVERAKKLQEEIRAEEVMRLARSLKEKGTLKVDIDVGGRGF